MASASEITRRTAEWTAASVEVIALLTSSARTATTTGASISIPATPPAILWILDVTAAATEVDDTLNVVIQSQLDGTNWDDIAVFTEVLGNGGAKRFGLQQHYHAAIAVTDLTASATIGMLGNTVRAVGTQVDAGGGADSFTYSVLARIY